VDQLQLVGKRGRAAAYPGARRPHADAAATSSTSRSSWRAANCSRTRAGSPSPIRRTTADRHFPDPRLGRQPEGHPAAEPVRAHAAARGGPAERDPRSAALRAAGGEGHFVWSSTRRTRRSCGRCSSATGTATAGSSRRAWPAATACGRRRAAARAGAAVKVTPYTPKPSRPRRRGQARRPGRRCRCTSKPASRLDAEAIRLLKGFAPAMKAGTNPIEVTGSRTAAATTPPRRTGQAAGDGGARGAARRRHRGRPHPAEAPLDVTAAAATARPAASSSPSPVTGRRRCSRDSSSNGRFRRGRLDHHLPGRSGVDGRAAGAAVPTITPVQVTVWRPIPARLEDAGRLGRLADRVAGQRRRQHAVHVVDQLGQRPADADRLLLARHRPDIARWQVQNRVNLALPQLPPR